MSNKQPRREVRKRSVFSWDQAVYHSPTARTMIEELSSDLNQAKWFYQCVSDGAGHWPKGFFKRMNDAIRETCKIMETSPPHMLRFQDDQWGFGHTATAIMSAVVARLVRERRLSILSEDGRKAYRRILQAIPGVLSPYETPAPERCRTSIPVLGGPVYGADRAELALEVWDRLYPSEGDVIFRMLRSYCPSVARCWDDKFRMGVAQLLADGKIRRYEEPPHTDLLRVAANSRRKGTGTRGRRRNQAVVRVAKEIIKSGAINCPPVRWKALLPRYAGKLPKYYTAETLRGAVRRELKRTK